MKIIAFIEDEEVIKKILKHLGLWEVQKRAPPKNRTPPVIEYIRLEPFIDDHSAFYPDPEYLVEAYISQN